MSKSAIKTSRASFPVVFEREHDGRWIAEISKLPGVLAYGVTKTEARQKVYAVALRTLADRVEQSDRTPAPVANLFHAVARS